MSVAAGLALAACGGGGGDPPGLEVGFLQATSSGGEASTIRILVQLTSRVGPLTEDLTVAVRNENTGTTTAGLDHDFLAQAVLVFPAGSTDGATLPIEVNLLGDDAVEGDETAHLRVYATTGVAVGPFATHELLVEERNFAEVSFVQNSSSTVDEATAEFIHVALHLVPGDFLDVDVEVSITGSGGTATGGVDYTAIPSRLIIPRGSPDGHLSLVQILPLEDDVAELDETALLTLENTSSGLRVRAPVAHTVTIPDDDRVDGFLVVSGAIEGASEEILSSGASFDLGTQRLRTAPDTILDLVVHNAGALPMDVEPLLVFGDSADFPVVLDQVGAGARVALTARPAPFERIEEDPIDGVRARLDRTLCAELARVPGGLRLTDVPLPGGERVALALEPVALPFTDDALVLVDGAPVALEDLSPDLSLWRGHVTGEPDSSVVLALSAESAHGWIHRGADRGTVHLLSESPAPGSAAAAPVLRLVDDVQLAAADLRSPEWPCAAALDAPGLAVDLQPPPASQVLSVALPGTLPVCRLAIETDYQFYTQLGTAGRVTDYLTLLVAAVAEVFEEQAQTTLAVSYLGIHGSSSDGWTGPDQGSPPIELLEEFRAGWADRWPVEADLAHFISGAFLGGGAAYTGAICNSGFGFGVSTDVAGNIDWSRFRRTSSSANWDFIVVAHELGHGFGALHTQDYCPPLDVCASNCSGTLLCRQGTLMSYCHLCGGISNILLEFHPQVASTMRAGARCLPPGSLGAGGTLRMSIAFEPITSLGQKAVALELHHGAANAPNPFRIRLTGVSN